MDNEMIERVMKAAYTSNSDMIFEDMPDSYRDIWRKLAIATIKAMREPTEKMCEAARFSETAQSGVYGCDEIYTAMIDAIINE